MSALDLFFSSFRARFGLSQSEMEAKVRFFILTHERKKKVHFHFKSLSVSLHDGVEQRDTSESYK